MPCCDSHRSWGKQCNLYNFVVDGSTYRAKKKREEFHNCSLLVYITKNFNALFLQRY